MAEVRIRAMSAADLERVVEIATGLREAPKWAAPVYLAALDPSKMPRRIALVAELAWEEQTSGAKAPVDLLQLNVRAKARTLHEAYPPGSGRVIGFAVASVVAPEAELETIALAAEGQRRGVGARLVGALVEQLRRERVTELLLEVRASNQAALAFYRAEGFRKTGRRVGYYADPKEDAVLMVRRLG